MSAWEVALGAALGIVATEFTEISPWLAGRVVQWSARRWSTDEDTAAAYAEEWTAVINDRPGKLFKLLTALAFAGGALLRAVPRSASKEQRRIRQWALSIFWRRGSAWILAGVSAFAVVWAVAGIAFLAIKAGIPEGAVLAVVMLLWGASLIGFIASLGGRRRSRKPDES